MSYFINEDLTQQLSNDKKDEPVIFDDCVQNILKNLNNNILKEQQIPNKISKLLAMKWFLENEI